MSLLRKDMIKPKPTPAVLKDASHTMQPNDPGRMLFRGKDNSVWKFWEHGVTSSFLNCFLTCLEQTRLTYVEGWRSRRVPLAFEFGTCNHWILEQAYKDHHCLDKKGVIQKIEQYDKLWKKQVLAPTAKQLQQQEFVYGLAEAVMPIYFQRWEGDFTKKYKYPNPSAAPQDWVSLEENFCIPYTFPDGKQTFLRGRRDGVFVDKRGAVWVFDTKCRSIINHDTAIDTLPFDLQQMLYLLVTREQMKNGDAKKHGIKRWHPSGVIMNIIRRPGHRQGRSESMPAFLERIAKDVAQPKKYDHSFVRYEMVIGIDELKAWEENTFHPLMNAVRMWWEGTLPHYMNHNALVTKYGTCTLYLPIVKGYFGDCYRTKFAFNELAEV